jgi:hypothetical protein
VWISVAVHTSLSILAGLLSSVLAFIVLYGVYYRLFVRSVKGDGGIKGKPRWSVI